MFKSKKKIKEEIKKQLENSYLFGVDISEGYLELVTYNLKTKNKESNFYDIIDYELLNELHKRRRMDTLKCFDKIYNDVTINEVEQQKACMDFINKGNKFKVEYNVSKDLVRKNEEKEFISKFINLYSLDKSVYGIDDKIIDITKRPPVVKQSNIVFLDKENYVKELHLNGDFVCANELPGIKEMKNMQEKINNGKRI